MPQALSYPLTSLIEIERIWSISGVTLRLDDIINENLDGGDSSNTVLEIIDQATDEIYSYLCGLYNDSDLYNSTFVRRHTSFVAAFYLSQRRGNPSQFETQYNRSIAAMERIRNLESVVPHIPYKSDMTPALSNIRIDDRYIQNKIRVQQSTSTGGNPTDAQQDIDMVYPWLWY